MTQQYKIILGIACVHSDNFNLPDGESGWCYIEMKQNITVNNSKIYKISKKKSKANVMMRKNVFAAQKGYALINVSLTLSVTDILVCTYILL